MKCQIAVVFALLAVFLTGCSQNKTQAEPQAAPEKSVTVVATPDPDKQLKEDIKEYLMQTYSEQEISKISLQQIFVDVDVQSDITKADGKPDNWDEMRSEVVEINSGLMEAINGKSDRKSVVLSLVGDDQNNLLVVKDGKITWDIFSDQDIVSSADNNPTISLEEFNAIQTGMEYQEVFDIVGSRGTLMSESDLGLGDKHYTAIFSWDGEGSIGANANVIFQGGKVISKSQFGLE